MRSYDTGRRRSGADLSSCLSGGRGFPEPEGGGLTRERTSTSQTKGLTLAVRRARSIGPPTLHGNEEGATPAAGAAEGTTSASEMLTGFSPSAAWDREDRQEVFATIQKHKQKRGRRQTRRQAVM
eukprot:scaffold205523_cov34-Tisochrysis_lutea.AAC.5